MYNEKIRVQRLLDRRQVIDSPEDSTAFDADQEFGSNTVKMVIFTFSHPHSFSQTQIAY